MVPMIPVTARRQSRRLLHQGLRGTTGTGSIAAGAVPVLLRTSIAGARLSDGLLLHGVHLSEPGGMTVDMTVVAVAPEGVMDWMTEGEVELCFSGISRDSV